MSAIPAEMPRWRRIALPASIILNLFLIAVIGGHLLNVGRHRENFGLPLARAISRAEELLPPQDAAAFGAVMRRDEAHFAKAAQALRDARQELDRQIVADPFNPAAARQALHATQMAWNQFLDDFSDPLVDGLKQVSPQGRRKLIKETYLGVRATPP
jgi:uncharacterized membrane protein